MGLRKGINEKDEDTEEEKKGGAADGEDDEEDHAVMKTEYLTLDYIQKVQ